MKILKYLIIFGTAFSGLAQAGADKNLASVTFVDSYCIGQDNQSYSGKTRIFGRFRDGAFMIPPQDFEVLENRCRATGEFKKLEASHQGEAYDIVTPAWTYGEVIPMAGNVIYAAVAVTFVAIAVRDMSKAAWSWGQSAYAWYLGNPKID